MAAQRGTAHDASWVAILDLERATGLNGRQRKEMGQRFLLLGYCYLILCTLDAVKQMGEGRDACATAMAMMAHGGSQETRAATDFCLATCAFLRVWMQRGNRRWLEAARLDSTVVETFFFSFSVSRKLSEAQGGSSAV